MPARVLIVDDEPSIAMSLDFIMQKEGYDVTVVDDGAKALDHLQNERPEVVLLDVMLPEHDGFEVCRRIRANEAWDDVKVLMITAKGREEDVTKGMELGADGYITKPFAIKEVVATVNDLLA